MLFRSDCLNILVVGDSFTTFLGNGATIDGLVEVEWPYFLKSKLAEQLGDKIRIKNFGRPSAGVLQMVDLAAAQCQVEEPDIVIIAFITRDLLRRRRYQTTLTVGGGLREVMYADPIERPALSRTLEVGLIDTDITSTWAAERIRDQESDALLERLKRSYFEQRRRKIGRAHV